MHSMVRIRLSLQHLLSMARDYLAKYEKDALRTAGNDFNELACGYMEDLSLHRADRHAQELRWSLGNRRQPPGRRSTERPITPRASNMYLRIRKVRPLSRIRLGTIRSCYQFTSAAELV
ncbi:MAG: hypothetical protein LW724_09820 [Planctomycetaceae bacterium]|nr:hypothetical protein [Planctomycetaceae bacterium]